MGNPMSADVVAERQIIAIVLAPHCPDEILARFVVIPPDAWQHPAHNVVASVLRDRIVRRIPVDPLIVAEDSAAACGTDHQAARVRQLVIDAATGAPPFVAFDWYAEQILKQAYLRNVHQAAVRLAQLAERGLDGADIGEVTAQLRGYVDEMDGGYGLADADKPVSLESLMAQTEEPHEWLVPGLLERTDRLIITGFEGAGKTELVAQFGITLGAGLHPFTGHLVDPKPLRVLVLDVENSRRQIRRRWARMRTRVDELRARADADPVDWDDTVRFVIRPDGVDLASPPECARLEQAIALTSPDVVVGGPIYKLTRADVRDEPAARALVDVLDRLRVKHRFALVIEAHVGHGGEFTGGRRLRPVGSSLFLRWPEFGVGLRAHSEARQQERPDLVELVSWRGARDQRDFPTLLGHSRNELPWTPRDPEYRKRNHMPEWRRERAHITDRSF